jgi:hypothetical protein
MGYYLVVVALFPTAVLLCNGKKKTPKNDIRRHTDSGQMRITTRRGYRVLPGRTSMLRRTNLPANRVAYSDPEGCHLLITGP